MGGSALSAHDWLARRRPRIGSVYKERVMKNVSLLSASLLLCSAPAFAQAPDNTSRPAQTPDSNSQSDEASRTGQANANANKTTMNGCISERNGKYILMTNSMTNNQSTGQSSTNQST